MELLLKAEDWLTYSVVVAVTEEPGSVAMLPTVFSRWEGGRFWVRRNAEKRAVQLSRMFVNEHVHVFGHGKRWLYRRGKVCVSGIPFSVSRH